MGLTILLAWLLLSAYFALMSQLSSLRRFQLDFHFTGRNKVSLPPVTSKQFADPALILDPYKTSQLVDRYLSPPQL